MKMSWGRLFGSPLLTNSIGEAESGTRLCTKCKKYQYNFYAMCRNEVDKREEAKKETTSLDQEGGRS